MASNGQPSAANMTELETFLPGDGSNKDSKYKVTVVPAKPRDFESEKLNIDGKYYDPFKERKVQHQTSDCDTLTHLLKASLGSGILSMPLAFRHAGLVMGIASTVLVALICTHCAYIVVKCAHVLYYKVRVPSMSFADVGETAFASGPKWGKKYAKLCRISIQLGLFSAYFGTCSVYTVLIAKNILNVAHYHLGEVVSLRQCILLLLVPLVLLSWVPNLKSLAPVSMVANLFMGLGLGITFYYLVADLPPPSSVPAYVAPDLWKLPISFSLTIFAMEAIGVVMPLENSMKTPQHFTGLCGVLNQGMSGVTLVYILLGFVGYVKYGNATEESITLNLPKEEWLAQSVQILVALAVFCTYGLQYFVCLEIVWSGIKHRYTKNARLAEYAVRTLLTTVAVLAAAAVPQMQPIIGLIGAFCFSILGLIIPLFIEVVTYWDIGFGRFHWIIVKNVFVFAFGLLALVFGSYLAVLDIIAMVKDTDTSPSNATTAIANVTTTAIANVTTTAIANVTTTAIANVTTTILANLTTTTPLPLPST